MQFILLNFLGKVKTFLFDFRTHCLFLGPDLEQFFIYIVIDNIFRAMLFFARSPLMFTPLRAARFFK